MLFCYENFLLLNSIRIKKFLKFLFLESERERVKECEGKYTQKNSFEKVRNGRQNWTTNNGYGLWITDRNSIPTRMRMGLEWVYSDQNMRKLLRESERDKVIIVYKIWVDLGCRVLEGGKCLFLFIYFYLHTRIKWQDTLRILNDRHNKRRWNLWNI